MAKQSLARNLFDEAVAAGSAYLRKLVVDKTPESEWLDFKRGDHLDDAGIRTIWSRALSGFANNEGGVLIWGIDARKDKTTEIDAASDVKLIPRPEALCDRLRQLQPSATDPPLTGVESNVIFDNGSDGPGFVLSYVPESELKPHRAELVEGKPYFLRIGDSFANPTPSILRNLFFPRSASRLQIEVRPDWQGIPVHDGMNRPPDISIIYRVTIHNLGLVTAKEVFVIVDMAPYMLEVDLPYGAVQVETDNGFGIEFSRPVHPASKAFLCGIRHNVGVGTRTSTGDKLFVPRPTTFAANFHIYAADMQPMRVRAEIGDMAIDRKAQVWARPMTRETMGD